MVTLKEGRATSARLGHSALSAHVEWQMPSTAGRPHSGRDAKPELIDHVPQRGCNPVPALRSPLNWGNRAGHGHTQPSGLRAGLEGLSVPRLPLSSSVPPCRGRAPAHSPSLSPSPTLPPSSYMLGVWVPSSRLSPSARGHSSRIACIPPGLWPAAPGCAG